MDQDLRTVRKRRGLTQDELAEQSGVSQGALSAYERGARFITETAAQDLAEALDEDWVKLYVGTTVEKIQEDLEAGNQDPVELLKSATRITQLSRDRAQEDLTDEQWNVIGSAAKVVIEIALESREEALRRLGGMPAEEVAS